MLFSAERPRSPAPDRWRDECRERNDQALGVPAGSHSVDRMVRAISFCRIRRARHQELNQESISNDQRNHAWPDA